MVIWYCNECNVNIDKSQKARHLRSKKHRINSNQTYNCNLFNEDVLVDQRIQHEESVKHKNNEMKELPFYDVKIEDTWTCDICDKTVKIQYKEKHLKSMEHKVKEFQENEVIELAMKKKIKTIRIKNTKNEKDVDLLFRNIKPLLIEKIRENL